MAMSRWQVSTYTSTIATTALPAAAMKLRTATGTRSHPATATASRAPTPVATGSRRAILPVTVNKHSARHEDDGSVTIVVAHRDPGFGNWMTTDGHSHGAIGLRWNQAVEDVEPTVEVVKV